MKKLIATILTIAMLLGITGAVPAFADGWAPTSSDDGYTNVLANYDMESLTAATGISGTQKITDSEFAATTFNTDVWGTSVNATIVSASAENLKDAAEHGNVVKQVGSTGEITEAASVKMGNQTSFLGKPGKAIMQVDVYVDTMSNNLIDIFNIASTYKNSSGSDKTSYDAPTIRFNADGTIQTFETSNGENVGTEVGTFNEKQWYTITVDVDLTGETKTYSAWINDEKVVDNKVPYGNLGISTSYQLRNMNLILSWGKGTVENAPTVYWDNYRIYTGDNLAVVGGSPIFKETEIIGGEVIDSPVSGDTHGKVIQLTSDSEAVRAEANPEYIDSEFSLQAPSDDKAIEYGQVKTEVDVYLTEAESDADVGVYYVDADGAEKYIDLVDMSGYSEGWHTVVTYVDAVNKKYTAYVDDVIKHNNADISDNGIVAPRALYVACNGTTVYADNMKFSVPEYYNAFGGGVSITGTQRINDEFTATTFDTNVYENVDATYYSIVSASDEKLPHADEHGNVVKQVGPTGSVTASNTKLYNKTDFWGTSSDRPTKAIMQVDVCVDTMPNSRIDVFNIASTPASGSGTNWEGKTISFDAASNKIIAWQLDEAGTGEESVEIATFTTNKWYTVTLEIDLSGTDRTYSAWINDEKVVDNKVPGAALNGCNNIKQIQLRMCWAKGTVENAPTVYWDNFEVYTGDNLAVAGIAKPKFVETRQGEDIYSLAYVLDGAATDKGTLIAAVYGANNTLASVNFDITQTALGTADKELLLTRFEKTAENTLRKLLWYDFNTIKPLISAQ